MLYTPHQIVRILGARSIGTVVSTPIVLRGGTFCTAGLHVWISLWYGLRARTQGKRCKGRGKFSAGETISVYQVSQ